MKKTEQLASRLHEVLLNGHWIAATNYKEQLQNTTMQQATQQVHRLNTIAALTFHINYYMAGILQVLHGGPLSIRDQYSFDLPPLQSEEAWQKLVSEFLTNAQRLTDTVAQLPDEKLDETFVLEKYGSYQRNLEGVIEHSYYHLGQIVLIKKLLSDHAS